MNPTRSGLRQYGVALRAMLVFTVLLGAAYPLAVLAVGQLALPAQANGSLLLQDGAVIGSSLIGQSFTDPDGAALPEWFQSRPSAAGYDAGASTGSNLGPENPDLVASVEERRAAIAALEGVDPAAVPADALTASASGVDPAISPEYALLQVPRVAAARGLDEGAVRALVEEHTEGRELGYLGEPTVDVLELNAALSQL
ncbi:K(+)-transporting ATPase subunit C [Rathayibacter tanaceti]|uniref:Potassium-transporting ATPase KdpC subunit n=2 Tax=Rathayibacter tanaceti TaxID=1671680 RepID=A0A166I6P0_9MICO|nr:K(+)-transporting ATPase subunit C [Rathayibacter tanaceti]KZX21715.1 Potassium-transporting ATPase C chain [Rathayibacter tanaceti]QHC54231.1 K(+)-transporting ATPase subunit C [Rathayibacter tanaceti]TCO37904.1 K+-transporting ATPase ATPase C chain [Rathayibacter tanaceti]